MARVVFDTSIWIELERSGGSLDLIEDTDRPLMAAPVLAELRSALLIPNMLQQRRLTTESFISDALELSDFVPIDLETAEIFAELKGYCTVSGKPRGINDLWIAATAIRHHAVLVSSDSRAQFQGLPNLKLRG